MGIFKKYKFTDKRQSRKGLIASGLFLLSLISLIAGIYVSYKHHGDGNIMVGFAGAASFVLSASGFIVGMKSFKEENIFLLFPWIGTVGSAVIWFGIACIILIGI
ncbi:MAG: hypothetical protein GX225_01685 [Clostridiales bacterium]|nr:hypothetical protein [Clostridiales bacterium]